jgi:hypothetical protein
VVTKTPPGSNALTLSDRPELRIDPTPILSTGAIAKLTHAQVYSVEGAAQLGSLFFEGEYFWVNLERAGQPSLRFENQGDAWSVTNVYLDRYVEEHLLLTAEASTESDEHRPTSGPQSRYQDLPQRLAVTAIQIDTTTVATDTIDYVATDIAGLTATSTSINSDEPTSSNHHPIQSPRIRRNNNSDGLELRGAFQGTSIWCLHDQVPAKYTRATPEGVPV